MLATYDRKSIWYARDILGQRRAAEGLIYDMFDFTANVYTVPPMRKSGTPDSVETLSLGLHVSL